MDSWGEEAIRTCFFRIGGYKAYQGIIHKRDGHIQPGFHPDERAPP